MSAIRQGTRVTCANVVRRDAPGHFRVEDGPWIVQRILSAVSGPGFYAALQHAETGEGTAGYVYERNAVGRD